MRHTRPLLHPGQRAPRPVHDRPARGRQHDRRHRLEGRRDRRVARVVRGPDPDRQGRAGDPHLPADALDDAVAEREGRRDPVADRRDRRRLGLARRHRRRDRRGPGLLHAVSRGIAAPDAVRDPRRGLLRGGHPALCTTSARGDGPRAHRGRRSPTAEEDVREYVDASASAWPTTASLRRPRGLPDPRAAIDGIAVYLDSAATSQKPRGGHRGDRRTTTATTTPTSTARVYELARAGRRTRSRARASGSPSSWARPRRRRSSRERDRGDQPRRATRGAATNLGARRRGARHRDGAPLATSCRGSCSARSTGAKLRYLHVHDDGELSLDELDAELARGNVKLVAVAHISQRARHDQPRRGDRRASARRRRARRWSTARRPCRRCRSTCARSAPTSTPGPGTRRSARRASACCTGAARCSRRCAPFLGGGDMIATVVEQELDLERAAVEVRGGHAADRRGGRPRRGGRLPRGDRHGTRARARARADRVRAGAAPEIPGIRVVGPTDADKRGGVGLVRRSRACTRTTSPSCSAARASAFAPATTARSR